jgi:signal peptidase I
MSEAIVAERSVSARIGLWLWSFVAPGLILLRVGAPRLAVVIFIANFALITLMPHSIFALSGASFGMMVLILGGYLAGSLFPLGLCLWAIMKFGKVRPSEPRWWQKWPTVAIALVAGLATMLSSSLVFPQPYRSFYAASMAMEPTLPVGTRMIADLRTPENVSRGDAVLYNLRGEIWVSRVVAVGGDRIRVKSGVPILNGVANTLYFTGETQEFFEELPSSWRGYTIRDERMSPMDNVAETIVPEGHVYLMGDNRDNSLDSRAEPAMGGPGLVPVENIVGRAAFLTWTKDWTWLGTPVE